MPSATSERRDRVAYRRYGDGPAVVFISGAGAWSAIDDITPATAELIAGRGLSAMVYDRLGRGDNRVDGTIDLAREIEAVAALVDAAGGRAVLCGHSSGCSIALYAATHGVPVDGLLLWEAPMDPATEGVREWTLEVERLLDAGESAAALEHYMKDIPPEILSGMRAGPIWGQMVEQAESLRPDAESLRWAYAAPFRDVFGTALGEQRVRVRARYGTETIPEMPAAAAAIADAVPGTEQGEIVGAWHSWEPAAMAEDLVGFVRNRG